MAGWAALYQSTVLSYFPEHSPNYLSISVRSEAYVCPSTVMRKLPRPSHRQAVKGHWKESETKLCTDDGASFGTAADPIAVVTL